MGESFDHALELHIDVATAEITYIKAIIEARERYTHLPSYAEKMLDEVFHSNRTNVSRIIDQVKMGKRSPKLEEFLAFMKQGACEW